MSTLTIALPDDMKAQLDEISRSSRRTPDELVQECLRRYLVAEKLGALRQTIAPLAEAQGFLADDDVFKAVS